MASSAKRSRIATDHDNPAELMDEEKSSNEGIYSDEESDLDHELANEIDETR